MPHEPPYALTKDEDDRGREVDALYALALRMRDQPCEEWPTRLLMLGDQVYADEVSPRALEFIRVAPRHDEPPGEEVADFEEYTRLYWESWGEPVMRWLLSTIATAMIFDDHDVHDDWNISTSWLEDCGAEAVVGRAHPRRVHVVLGLPAHRQPRARRTCTTDEVLRQGLRGRRRDRRSCASSRSRPTARPRARAGASAATTAACA